VSALRALLQLGLGPMPICPGRSREPLWPDGFCGSITHCEGYSAAIVARRDCISAIGIDAERRQSLAAGVLERISLDIEREWMNGADPRLPWEILLFSAKESVFKAWFPLVGTWLGFHDARIEFQPEAGTFRAVILPGRASPTSAAPSTLSGRFRVTPERVQTSAFIRVRSSSP
jgi:4'-phosphopantetheinyl transferase EntD